MGNELIPLST